RLKAGVPAPQSGSLALNGKIVAEQIGAQIFIDAWGLVSPADPALAADLARRAACVSHDGEAVYGAQVIASLVAHAFVESNLNQLLDTSLTFIPKDSVIQRLIADIRNWHATDPRDWRAARAKLEAQYGYHLYGGNCHIVPNHGLVILSLLYSGGDFNTAQTIVNTCGWDTDCNAGNVGCILGVRNGLAAFNQLDWRTPVADRLYLPTADGGRAISDAVRETDFILQSAYALHSQLYAAPKNGARFHFSLPGSVQGFQVLDVASSSVSNTPHPNLPNERCLTLDFRLDAFGMSAMFTPTFIPAEAISMPGSYELYASPTLYPGQIVQAEVIASASNKLPIDVSLAIQWYSEDDRLFILEAPPTTLNPGEAGKLEWKIPELNGAAIAQVGLAVASDEPQTGQLHLNALTWDGTPAVSFHRPATTGTMWPRQWVNAADVFTSEFGEAFRVIQNHGRGLVITGTREWTNYAVQTALTPHLAQACGLAARVQGLRRYYALLLAPNGKLRLTKVLNTEQVLAEIDFAWELERAYQLNLEVEANRLRALVDGRLVFELADADAPLLSGAIALVVEDGCCGTQAVKIAPLG
ncbi:MAG: ADP-ribosylglycohydrolase family protein, partial [Anaerolineales bacterium]|nr:ADP-ribosylglycohydrolase family protein [Anaerolineales bacterium]